MRWIFLIATLILPAARGDLFQIINRSYGSYPPEMVDPIFDQLEVQVNENLPDADASTYLKGVANATVMSASGMGADYSAAYGIALLGVKLGVGADLGDNSLGDLNSANLDTLGGAAPQATVLIGIDPALFFKVKKKAQISRLKFYLNFLTYSYSYENFSGSLTSFGLTGQYKLIEAFRTKWGWFRWGGVDLTAGIRKSALSVVISQPVTEMVDDSLDVTFNGTANVGADIDIWSIPIELSTSTRLLYFLSLFGGLGLDINFGSSASIATLNGPITVSDSGVSADATLDLGQDSNPDALTGRLFAGVGVDFAAFNVHLQLNHSLSNNIVGITAGANVYW